MVAIEWDNSAIHLSFRAESDGPVRLVDIRLDSRSAQEPQASGSSVKGVQPLVEIMTPQWGNENSSNSSRYSGTFVGSELRYVEHTSSTDRLEIVQQDVGTGVLVRSVLSAAPGVPAVRSETIVSVLPGSAPVTLWAVTSWATGAVISDDINSLEVWRADCTWAAENRWHAQPLRSPGLVAIDRQARGETCRNAVSATAFSTWSSGDYVPAGAVRNRATGQTLAWQVEHNGAWHWEVGERPDWRADWQIKAAKRDEAAGHTVGDRSGDGAYVAVLGPTDYRHQWSCTVSESNHFTTVPVTFTVGVSFDEAFGQLASYRRATRRDHPQNHTLPVIFNDYMDTLDGDPTEAKLLPLIDAAAEVGCEYFCIDAGWYDDTSGWWASVGDWQPSTVRFPRGLKFILDYIRDRGMSPGLWMEPEVVGVTSQAAVMLPADAFLQRCGVRIRERQRYLLDLRSQAAVDHLDGAVDRLVNELGVAYFKFDYNVTPGPGTDLGGVAAGHGLLEHNRAVLAWLDRVLDRHPELIIENCGSGALRSDFAMLSRLQLQSTSDQEDPLLYPAIAAGALVHILPEQAGNWAYPQAEMSDEMIIFTTCTGLSGRLYQAGLIDRMSPVQRQLVAAGVQAHKETRGLLATSIPHFPTGLPSWDDPWTTVAFETAAETYVIAWRQDDAPATVELDLPDLDTTMTVSQVYPPTEVGEKWSVSRTESGVSITSPMPGAGARMFRLGRV